MSDVVLNNETMRINYHGGKNFFNINTHNAWATTVWNLDEFNYWVVVRFTDGRYSPHQIVCVPAREWFIDWAEANKGLFEIVFSPDPQDSVTDLQPSDPETTLRPSKAQTKAHTSKGGLG